MQTKEEIEKFYSKRDPYNFFNTEDDFKRRDIFLNLISGRMYNKILDIGCGEGFITNSIPYINTENIIGIDIVSSAIKCADEMKKNNNITYKQMDFFNDNFDDKIKFDLIICTEILAAFSGHLDKVIDKILHLLKDDGDLLISMRKFADTDDGFYTDFIKAISSKNLFLIKKETMTEYRDKGFSLVTFLFTKKPQVTIITQTYNRLDLLKRTIESVKRQNVFSWQHIIIDNVSTDNTEKFCIELQDNDSRFLYIKLKSHRGIRLMHENIEDVHDIVKSKYITHIDDDDVFRQNRLKIPIQYLEQHQAVDMVYTDSLHHEIFDNIYKIKRWRSKDFDIDKLQKYNYIGSCEGFYRSEIANDVDIRNLKIPSTHTDDWFLWQTIAKKHLIMHIPEVLTEIYVGNTKYNKLKFEETILTDDMISKDNIWPGSNKLDFYD